MANEHKDKILIISLIVGFILINLPPGLVYLSSFKNMVLGFGYVLGGCILSSLAGVIISAIISAGIARVRKRALSSLNTAKLILICSIVVALLLKIKWK